MPLHRLINLEEQKVRHEKDIQFFAGLLVAQTFSGCANSTVRPGAAVPIAPSPRSEAPSGNESKSKGFPVKVYGAVKSPGEYTIEPGTTVRQLIELSRGFTKFVWLSGSAFYTKAQEENLVKSDRHADAFPNTKIYNAKVVGLYVGEHTPY